MIGKTIIIGREDEDILIREVFRVMYYLESGWFR